MARAPLGPTSFASLVKKCTTSKRIVLIDLDITRVQDNYKTGNETEFLRMSGVLEILCHSFTIKFYRSDA